MSIRKHSLCLESLHVTTRNLDRHLINSNIFALQTEIMGIILQIALDLCNCCKSTGHHDPARGKSMSEYGSNFDAKEYAKKGKERKLRIPSKWKCGKCHKINKKGIEFCIYCDNKYNDLYRMTDVSKQGEESHFVEISVHGDQNGEGGGNNDNNDINNNDKRQSQIGLDPNKENIMNQPHIKQLNSNEPEHEHGLQNSIDYALMEEVLDDIPMDNEENNGNIEND